MAVSIVLFKVSQFDQEQIPVPAFSSWIFLESSVSSSNNILLMLVI